MDSTMSKLPDQEINWTFLLIGPGLFDFLWSWLQITDMGIELDISISVWNHGWKKNNVMWPKAGLCFPESIYGDFSFTFWAVTTYYLVALLLRVLSLLQTWSLSMLVFGAQFCQEGVNWLQTSDTIHLIYKGRGRVIRQLFGQWTPHHFEIVNSIKLIAS